MGCSVLVFRQGPCYLLPDLPKKVGFRKHTVVEFPVTWAPFHFVEVNVHNHRSVVKIRGEWGGDPNQLNVGGQTCVYYKVVKSCLLVILPLIFVPQSPCFVTANWMQFSIYVQEFIVLDVFVQFTARFRSH